MPEKFKKIALLVAVFMMFCVITVGYAALSQELSITGEASVSPPFKGVYITDVEIISSNNVTGATCEYINPTNLKTELNVTSANASITYKITVRNNTEITYWYLGINRSSEYGNNSLIDKNNGIFITTKDHLNDSSATFDNSDWVPAQTERVFYATYRFGSNATGKISNLLNFNFGMRMDAVQDEFLKIVNDKISSNGYYYLSGVFDEKYAQDGTTVIGNIGEDTEIFDNLFGPDITVNVDGDQKPVKIMISRKNMDGKTGTGDSYSGAGAPVGCEYTVYITTDSLDGSTATVFAVSYTCGADGVWYQVGDLYEGICSTATYDSDGNKCFNISSWDAVPKIYQVTNDISYKVGYQDGDQFAQYDTMEELLSASDNSMFNAVNNTRDKLLRPVYEILYTFVSNGQKEYENEANKYKQGYDQLKAAFDRLKPYCNTQNGGSGIQLTDKANSLTRAEMIAMLEAIQHNYDYYLSVN